MLRIVRLTLQQLPPSRYTGGCSRDIIGLCCNDRLEESCASPQEESKESKEEAASDTAWDVEYVASDEDGLVIFDGGTYSRGPAALFDRDDAASPSSDDVALEADKERLERHFSLEASTLASSWYGRLHRDIQQASSGSEKMR